MIEFIKKFKIADTDILTEAFYLNKRKAQQRLNEIVKNTEIQRCRETFNEPYIYYNKKKPMQTKHSLKVTEFYIAFSKRYKITNYMLEKNLGRIRPDAAFTYIDGDIQKIGLLEVELSNKGFDFEKYQNWLKYEEWKKYMTMKPLIFIHTKNKIANVNEPNYEYIDIDQMKRESKSRGNNNNTERMKIVS